MTERGPRVRGRPTLPTLVPDGTADFRSHAPAAVAFSHRPGRPSAPRSVGGWEVGLLVFMALLYLAGVYINPGFFGSGDAVSLGPARHRPLRRDGGRHDLRHRQQGPRPLGRLDPRPGRHASSRSPSPRPISTSASAGARSSRSPPALAIGLLNGLLVTVLLVPSFIATLTMLFIGRGLVLGLTGGKTIAYEQKAASTPGSSRSARPTRSASTTRS